MHPLSIVLLAGFVAGAMNALAGGGSFVSLPALIAAGVPSVNANASSTVALLPGGLGGALLGRRMPPAATRIATPALTTAITVAFFVRTYAHN